MKFNPTDWKEVKPNAEIEVGQQALLQLRTTAHASLFVTTEGVEALAGEGTAFYVSIPPLSSFKVNLLTPGKVYQKVTHNRAFRDTSEVFTNIDRLPHESGNMAAVLAPGRIQQLNFNRMMRQMKAERAALLDVIDDHKAKPPVAAPPPPVTPSAPPAEPAA